MVSCTGVFTFVILAGACILGIISLATSHWVEYETTGGNFGLWQLCNSSGECQTRVGKDVGDWFLVVEVAYSAFVLLLLCSLVELLFHLCCMRCTGTCCVTLAAIDMVIGLVCCVGSLVMFGVKAHDVNFAGFDGNIKFAWSYYLAMAAGVLTVLCLFFVLCEIPKSRTRAKYQVIRPVE